ncbi:MAG: hypothetical protein RMX97_04895 [Nostoc sp. DedQUE11]|nr:hypothetical protein [Nostoc sp. DedQUE11]
MKEIGMVGWLAFNVVIIIRESKPEIAVRLDQVRNPKNTLIPGTFVTFDVDFHPLNNSIEVGKNLELLILKMSELKDENFIIQIATIIKKYSEKERDLLFINLPLAVKQHQIIFPLLTLNEQIELAYFSLMNGSSKLWQILSPYQKILCIYHIAKESENLPLILTVLKRLQTEIPEKNFLVKSALKLLWAKENPERCNEVFQQVHELLINYVIKYIKNSTELINIDPLLPYCKPTEITVKYCEGKLWERQEVKTADEAQIITSAYCPRARNNCNLFEQNKKENSNFGLYGARLYAECSQDWKDWSLLELFKAVNIVPSLPDLKRPEDYLPKLSGWINRINEIRSRLKCSVCKDIMPHNIEYSQFSTRFRVTVFSCKHGKGHDSNIYLNECWGCSQIIDSRESRYQSPENNYYICIHCGSGTQYSNTYTQGDICPKCGTIGMEVSPNNNRYRKCHSCKHSIKLPEERKITGSKCPQCRTQGMMLTVNQKNKQVRLCRSHSCGYSISAT